MLFWNVCCYCQIVTAVNNFFDTMTSSAGSSRCPMLVNAVTDWYVSGHIVPFIYRNGCLNLE